MDTVKYVAAGEKTLSASISSSATTIALSDVNSRAGDALTMTDFGTIGYATIDPGGSNMELISFTGVSSTSLTGVTRGLAFEAPYTNVAALQNAHAAGTKLVFSNSPQLYDELAGKDNDETITGTWTFTNTALPTLDSYAAPTDNAELAAKKYVDDVAAGGTASINRVVVDGVAGATVAAGDLVYQDSADGEWKLCDADTAATVDNVLLGIAQGSGTDGNTITGGVLLSGLDSNQSGLTAGAVQYASNTAGGLVESPGTTEVTVGQAHGSDATAFYFAPRFNQQITEAQQDTLDALTASAAELNQLDGATITAAQLTEAGTFFGATGLTGAEAETLSDGSNADTLHVHASEQYFTGFRERYKYGSRILYPSWDMANSDGGFNTTATGTATVSLDNDKTSLDAGGSNGDDAVVRLAGFDSGADSNLQFSATSFLLFMATLGISGSTNVKFSFGFIDSAVATAAVDKGGTNSGAWFTVDTSGSLWACQAGGSTNENTQITGITLASANSYRIEVDQAANTTKYYVNNTLEVTHSDSADMPDGGSNVSGHLASTATGSGTGDAFILHAEWHVG